MKISVLTASVRPEGLDIVKKSLDKQDFPKEDFEWIIVGNQNVVDFAQQYQADYLIKLILERPKREGDFYNLDKAYNDLFEHASGELAIMWTDMTWAPNDVLSNFWNHYQQNPTACVGAVGDQYDPTLIEFGKPQVVVWKDPRKRLDQGSFYEIYPIDFEMCLASIPVKAVKEAGGFDEKWDEFAALGEKELCLRMEKLGYKFCLDQSIEYRALKHDRLHGKHLWDEKYELGCKYFEKCLQEINNGSRLKLSFL